MEKNVAERTRGDIQVKGLNYSGFLSPSHIGSVPTEFQ